MPAPLTVAVTDTRGSARYGADPKTVLANLKSMVAAEQPNLGIGDYDSFEMVGGAIVFGKGKYMCQVTCLIGISTDKMKEIARLVAKHM
jgi:hypothetical protein